MQFATTRWDKCPYATVQAIERLERAASLSDRLLRYSSIAVLNFEVKYDVGSGRWAVPRSTNQCNANRQNDGEKY